MKLQSLDLLVLLVFMAVITAMGFYFARRNTATEEYFLGGRRFPGWAIGLSMMGTAISSITFLSMPADAFKTTWIRFIPYFAMPLCVLFSAVFLVPIYRRANITSAYEYLESRFGPSIRVYGGITYMIAQLLRVSMVLYLLALLLHEITGIDEITCVIISGIFVGLYTVVGGIDAVIWTDVLQTVILASGSLICLWVIVDALPNGFQDILDIANAHNKFSLGAVVNGALVPPSWHFDLGSKTATMIFLIGITFFLTEYAASQHMVQRYCAAKNVAEARKGMFFTAVFSMPVWFFYMFLGTALFVFFTVYPQPEVAAMLDGSSKSEQVVPYFVLNYLPAGVAGLVIAAAIAAGMSSLDSSINAVSTVSVVDIYRRHLKPGQEDRHYLQVAKGVAMVTTLLMILGAIALFRFDTKTLQDTSIILTSLVSGGMLGLFALGLLTTRGNSRCVWAGVVMTLLFTLWTILLQKNLLPQSLSAPFDLYYTATLANLLLFVVGYGLALLFPGQQQRDLTNLTVWTMEKQAD